MGHIYALIITLLRGKDIVKFVVLLATFQVNIL